MTHSKDPYKDTISSSVLKRLTKHVIGQIAKISGELPSGFVGEDFCCHIRENVGQSHGVHGDIAATGDLQGQCTFRVEGDLHGHGSHRNINTATMPTCDVLLPHFTKMMLYRTRSKNSPPFMHLIFCHLKQLEMKWTRTLKVTNI